MNKDFEINLSKFLIKIFSNCLNFFWKVNYNQALFSADSSFLVSFIYIYKAMHSSSTALLNVDSIWDKLKSKYNTFLLPKFGEEV